MPRNYLAESKGRLVEVCAFLTAWAEDMQPVDGNMDVFSRVVIAREGARDALEALNEIERGAGGLRVPPDPEPLTP